MRSTTFPLAFPTKRAKSATDFPTKGGRGLFILLQHQEGRNKTVAVACMVAQRTGSAGGRGLLGCTRLTPRPVRSAARHPSLEHAAGRQQALCLVRRVRSSACTAIFLQNFKGITLLYSFIASVSCAQTRYCEINMQTIAVVYR